MSQEDELEGFKASVAKKLEDAGVDTMTLNGELIVKPSGFRKNNHGTDGVDPDALASNILEERMHKLRKKLGDDGLIEELEGLDEDGLRARISRCETNILESEKAKAADTELAALKDKVKEANSPYAETKKTQRAIAEYAACLLDKAGVA